MPTASALTLALGRSTVLAAASDSRRRALARDEHGLLGVAAFVPLYGPRAEFALSLRRAADRAVTAELLERLAALAGEVGIDTLRADVAGDQLELAQTIRAGRLLRGGLYLAVTDARP